MGTGKTYSTQYLADSNNNTGVAGQVLSTTSTGIDWVDSSVIPGFGLWLENGNDIYNSNSGNVGIGVTGPDNKLHVHETSTASGKWEVAKFEGDSTVGGGITISSSDTGANWSLITQGTTGGALDNNLSFHLTNAGTSGGATGYKMTLEASSGFLGIGTTSPDTKLHVDSVSAFPTLTLARSTTHPS